jgi:hypothetical protein
VGRIFEVNSHPVVTSQKTTTSGAYHGLFIGFRSTVIGNGRFPAIVTTPREC